MIELNKTYISYILELFSFPFQDRKPVFFIFVQNAASYQGLHCLLTGIFYEITTKMKKSTRTLKLELDSSE